MLKGSVFAEDIWHWPPDDLHHVYDFPITELEAVCVLPYCIDEKRRRNKRDPKYLRSPRTPTGGIPWVYESKFREWPAPECIPLVLGMWGSQKPPREQAEVDHRWPASAAGWNTDGCWRAENKSKADAQKPDVQGGQEGTDKGFHYLKGRERHLEDKQEHQPPRENPHKHWFSQTRCSTANQREED